MEEQFLLFGLSDDEAIRIRNAGGGNASPPAMTKSTEQIVRDNLCTLSTCSIFLLPWPLHE